MDVRRIRPLFQSPHPRRNQYAPSFVGAKSARLRFRHKPPASDENFARSLAPPLKTEPATLGFGFVKKRKAIPSRLLSKTKPMALFLQRERSKRKVRLPPLKTKPATLGFGFVKKRKVIPSRLLSKTKPAALFLQRERFQELCSLPCDSAQNRTRYAGLRFCIEAQSHSVAPPLKNKAFGFVFAKGCAGRWTLVSAGSVPGRPVAFELRPGWVGCKLIAF